MKKKLLIIILLLIVSSQAYALPVYDDVRKSYVKSDSILLDRHGDVLDEIRIDKKHRRLDWTGLKDISPSLPAAVIAAEDKRFYGHSGVDYRSLGAALWRRISATGKRGASTITMQLASFLDKDIQAGKKGRTIVQKGKQISAARDLEQIWTKDQILEAYLNLVTFRGEYQGVAAAARGLFGKEPHGLNQSEALILASLVRAPNAIADNLSRRALNLNQVLGWSISPAQMQIKISELSVGIDRTRLQAGFAPHISRYMLADKPSGTILYCTLDGPMQRFAQEQMKQQLSALEKQNVNEGAVLVIENKTGNVLVYGSYTSKPKLGQYVDGIRAKRQAGSTLKPFLYGAAFDAHLLTAASIIDDSPLDIAVLSGIYQPANYDSSFHGLVTARLALASSLNVPAVKTLALVGTEPFLNKLRRLGIKNLDESGEYYGLSLALGSADVSLWELTNAYRTLANKGVWNEAHYTPDSNNKTNIKIFSPEASYIIADILSDREARSSTFGLENPLATRFWSAVKTGTSKDMRDNWCIGFSEKYTVGVWLGNYQGEPMWNVSGITGAAPVWITMMNILHRNDKNIKRKAPASLTKQKIEFTNLAEAGREEWFIRGTEPISNNQKAGQFNSRIVYPPSGTIIALDPDIPEELQRVFFIAQTRDKNMNWLLNDNLLGKADKSFCWSPVAGKHSLAIVDEAGKVIDVARFEVRGAQQYLLKK